MKPYWTSEILSKVQFKNDKAEVFDTTWDEVFSAVTDRPTDSILESAYKMRIEQVGGVEICVASLHSRGRHSAKYDYCRLKLMVQRLFKNSIKDSHVKARNRDVDRPAIGAPIKEEQKEKANTMP